MPVKNIIPGQKISKKKLQRARELRSEMTPSEAILWQELRRNKLGVHFRRQQIIAGYIVDFYCHSANLVVEIDGGIHNQKHQVEDDEKREQVLAETGLQIIRFRNAEITRDLPGVLNRIREALVI
jgi:very-short-patch-repair endonuclease